MKKLATWIYILTKRQLKNPLLLVLLLIVPLAAWGISFIPDMKNTLTYSVGLYSEGDDELADKLIASLENHNNSDIEFFKYDSLDKAYKDVKNKTLTCTYVFPSDLTQKLSGSDYKHSIKVVRQPGNDIQTSINEIVYSDLIRLEGYNIISDYLVSEGLLDLSDEASVKELFDYYDYYTASSETFHIDFETYGKSGLSTAVETGTSISFPLRGILSVLVFLSGLFGSVIWLKDNEKGIFATLSLNYKILCRILYIVIPTMLFALSMLVTIAVSNNFVSVKREIPAMLLLILLITVFCILLVLIVKNSKNFTACIPVILLGCLIFCPVFINAANYIPAVRYINKIFVPYYYLCMFM